MDYQSFVSQRLREARQAVFPAISRETMAEKMGDHGISVSSKTIQRWESPDDSTLPDAEQLRVWAEVTRQPLSFFYEQKGLLPSPSELEEKASPRGVASKSRPGVRPGGVEGGGTGAARIQLLVNGQLWLVLEMPQVEVFAAGAPEVDLEMGGASQAKALAGWRRAGAPPAE